MGIVTVGSAYLLNRDEMEGRGLRLTIQTGEADTPKGGNMALLMAILSPLAFVGVIVLMLVFDLKGGDATSMVSGTALILMCLGAFLGFGKDSLEKVTGYVTDRFPFCH